MTAPAAAEILNLVGFAIGGYGDTEQPHLGPDNVQRRLVGHYGSAAMRNLFRGDDGSTVAEITLPLDAATEEAGDDAAVANRIG